jgi:hypothetical protein
MSKKRGETKMDITDSIRCPAAIAEYKAKEDMRDAIVRGEKMADLSATVRNSVLTTQQPRARSRTFTAKPCTLCTALRGPDTNFTRVYATRDRVRYCRCTYCNNTWKDSDC